jgi:RecA/RadA recombinase
VRRIETLKDGTEAIGNRIRVKVLKNKLARRPSARPRWICFSGGGSAARAA